MQTAVDVTPQRGATFEPFLEGLRGVAAFYVVLHHATLQVFGDLSPVAKLVHKVFNFGHYAVAVFIVLSGYCLMLPVLRSPDGSIPGGFRSYIWRRARRLLPPYYATLAFILLVVACVPALRAAAGTRWDDALPVFDWGVIASHVLLLHNTNEHWITKLDAPLWSIATEWQIYFALPALLWIRRRWSMAVAVLTAFVVGYGVGFGFFALGAGVALEACPWYVGLFALGAAAAARAKRGGGSGSKLSWSAQALSWLALGAVVSVVEAKLQWLAAYGIPRRVIVDSIAGLATACFLLHCAQVAQSDQRSRSLALGLLEHRAVLFVGSFSYSLYLIHDPLIAWWHRGLFALGFSDEIRFWSLLLFAVPFCVLSAYILYVSVERRFIARHGVARPSSVASPVAKHA